MQPFQRLGEGAVQNVYVISSGTSFARKRQTVRSAAKALELALEQMRRRLPNVTITNGDGNPLSYFQLKELVQLEGPQRERAEGLTPGPGGRD
jgi:hypothetical protein